MTAPSGNANTPGLDALQGGAANTYIIGCEEDPDWTPPMRTRILTTNETILNKLIRIESEIENRFARAANSDYAQAGPGGKANTHLIPIKTAGGAQLPTSPSSRKILKNLSNVQIAEFAAFYRLNSLTWLKMRNSNRDRPTRLRKILVFMGAKRHIGGI